MKSIVSRLKIYLDHKRLGVIDLSVILDYKSPQKLYRLFNTKDANPSCQIIEDISAKFQDLNLNWLFTGRGNMLMGNEEDPGGYKERYFKCLEEKEELYKDIIKIMKTR